MYVSNSPALGRERDYLEEESPSTSRFERVWPDNGDWDAHHYTARSSPPPPGYPYFTSPYTDFTSPYTDFTSSRLPTVQILDYVAEGYTYESPPVPDSRYDEYGPNTHCSDLSFPTPSSQYSVDIEEPDCDNHSTIIDDLLRIPIWGHHHFEAVLKEESESPRSVLQSWAQPLMTRVYQELGRIDPFCLPLATRRICRKIVLNLAKNFGVLPVEFEIPVYSASSPMPTSNGGFADIFIVRRKDTMEHVCMKRLRLFGDQSQEQKEKIHRSFCHEAVLWKDLQHVNVLSFLGVTRDPAVCGPSFALISPYLANGNVMNYMRKAERFNPFKAVKEVADGLDYLHNCPTPVVHGDIKGANILVKDDGVCCICDFGLSIVTETFGMSVESSSAHLRGSAPWMAPEAFDPPVKLQAGQLKQENRPRDIYAFGCTMLEIFSGRTPWNEHRNMFTIYIAVKGGKRPDRPSPEEAPLLSNGMWKIIQWCWAQEPSSRLNAKEIVLSFDSL